MSYTPLPQRERAALRDRRLAARLDAILPGIMEAAGIDCWLLIAREDNEDPVLRTLLPGDWMGARRRTMLLLTRFGRERRAVARYRVGDVFESCWDGEGDQWSRLVEVLEEADPAKIGINLSASFGQADGLAHTDHAALMAALPEGLRGRIVSAEPLCLGWLEARLPEEIEDLRRLCDETRRVIEEGLAPGVIRLGETTNTELEWRYRERILDRRLDTWFQPTVAIQRAGDGAPDFAGGAGERPILAGDLLHIDLGLSDLGLHTDLQRHAFVAGPGEAAPAGLGPAMAAGNRLQDVLERAMRPGRSGNAILAEARAAAIEAGLEPCIYTHPMNLYGHGVGPTIGLWDKQGGVPGAGDAVLNAGAVFAIELKVEAPLPEWGRSVSIMLEENARFDGEGLDYLTPRQTEVLVAEGAAPQS